jgi:hypothetical protein
LRHGALPFVFIAQLSWRYRGLAANDKHRRGRSLFCRRRATQCLFAVAPHKDEANAEPSITGESRRNAAFTEVKFSDENGNGMPPFGRVLR